MVYTKPKGEQIHLYNNWGLGVGGGTSYAYSCVATPRP